MHGGNDREAVAITAFPEGSIVSQDRAVKIPVAIIQRCAGQLLPTGLRDHASDS